MDKNGQMMNNDSEIPVSSTEIDQAATNGCKRSGYLEWPEYFMAICFLSAMRSKDPCTQVGACIVSGDRKIVGIGYNGMPLGCSDDQLPWCKSSADPLQRKYMYVCHAEMNAIMNKNSADVKGCTIYVALFPCNECAKIIIQSGISKVVYMSDKHHQKHSTIASKRLLQMAGVECVQYIPPRRQITIDFDVINWTSLTQLPDSPPREVAPGGAGAGGGAAAHLVDAVRRNLSQLVTDDDDGGSGADRRSAPTAGPSARAQQALTSAENGQTGTGNESTGTENGPTGTESGQTSVENGLTGTENGPTGTGNAQTSVENGLTGTRNGPTDVGNGQTGVENGQTGTGNGPTDAESGKTDTDNGVVREASA